MPFWNPYIFCGMPFLANPQSAVFYPFSYLFVFMSFPAALNIFIVAHTFIAGYFAYKLAQSAGMNRSGSTAAAFVFMFNGFYLVHTEFMSNIACYAWLPAVLFYFHRLADRPGLKSALIVSLVAALQFFGGHPGYAYYTVLFAAAYYFWHKFEFGCFLKSLKTFLKVFFAAALPAALFTAAQSVPSFELIRNSVRDSGMDISNSATYSIAPLDFLRFMFCRYGTTSARSTPAMST